MILKQKHEFVTRLTQNSSHISPQQGSKVFSSTVLKCFTWSVNSTMVVVTSEPLGCVSVLTSVFLTVGVTITSLASRLSAVMVVTRLASLCKWSRSTDDDTGTDLFGFLGTTGLRWRKSQGLAFTSQNSLKHCYSRNTSPLQTFTQALNAQEKRITQGMNFDIKTNNRHWTDTWKTVRNT